MVAIRAERPSDIAGIRHVNVEAFAGPLEAAIVDALRDAGQLRVSLVAADGDHVVGHIAFSPVGLANDSAGLIAGLAPMAVLPARQRQGIGSALVGAGLDECRHLGVDAVVVLGHPDYYPRFGFVPASRYGISSKYDVPDEVFMALELRPGAFAGRAGLIRYHEAFDAA